MTRRIELLPELGILHRFVGRRLPALLLPAVDPARDAVAHVFAVGVQVHARGPLEGFEGRDRRQQLHAVVGREGFAAGKLLAVRAGDEDSAPAAGARISRAGAIRIDRHLRPVVGLRLAHADASRP